MFLCGLDILLERRGGPTVVAERGERRIGQRVDRVGTDQRFDVK